MDDYKNLLYNLEIDKLEVREKYLECAKENRIKYELVENAIKLPEKATLTNLLRAGEALVVEKRNSYEPKKTQLD